MTEQAEKQPFWEELSLPAPNLRISPEAYDALPEVSFHLKNPWQISQPCLKSRIPRIYPWGVCQISTDGEVGGCDKNVSLVRWLHPPWHFENGVDFQF
ncbi:MAG: hypothetical protein AAGK74_18595, partial [Chloroflexota bacterium]